MLLNYQEEAKRSFWGTFSWDRRGTARGGPRCFRCARYGSDDIRIRRTNNPLTSAASTRGFARAGVSLLSTINDARGPITSRGAPVTGVGPKLAETIHETLHVDTLEGLEIAAHDGRLENLPGWGPRRTAAIRASLDSVLGRRATRLLEQTERPSVASLLHVDGEYRTRAVSGRLPKIAPRRFNPKHEAWLPILHTDHDGWHFTVLFSNTARAHQLGRTEDWVVVYFYDGDHQEGQHTVVTETHGPLAGRRVVRGREAETRRHYQAQAQ